MRKDKNPWINCCHKVTQGNSSVWILGEASRKRVLVWRDSPCWLIKQFWETVLGMKLSRSQLNGKIFLWYAIGLIFPWEIPRYNLRVIMSERPFPEISLPMDTVIYKKLFFFWRYSSGIVWVVGDTCEGGHCSLLLLTLKFRMNSRKGSFVRSIRAALEQPGSLWSVHSGKFSGLNRMKSWSCFGSSLHLIPYAGVDDFWRSLLNISLI